MNGKDERFYYVRMGDDSLIEVGIRKGDALKLRRSVTFWTGDLIAATTPQGLRLAFAFHLPSGQVRLYPAHPRATVRTYPRHAVKVLGVYRGVDSTSTSPGDGCAPDATDEWPEYIDAGGAS
jgi:SOS-response transcriptional repressor LexA